MTTEDAFLRAIREEPKNDEIRLVFADWLEEHGHSDRAAFIRLELRLVEMEDRLQELWDEYEDEDEWAELQDRLQELQDEDEDERAELQDRLQ